MNKKILSLLVICTAVAANAEDPILTRIEHQTRVPTLIAQKTGDADYRFDIRLQGEGETVFFDV